MNLRQEREEEERDLRVERVDEDTVGENTPEANRGGNRGVRLGMTGEKNPEPESDQICGARVLDDGERESRGREHRRKSYSRGRDVGEAPVSIPSTDATPARRP